jgi:two-component system chemotaxis response regulator CheB
MIRIAIVAEQKLMQPIKKCLKDRGNIIIAYALSNPGEIVPYPAEISAAVIALNPKTAKTFVLSYAKNNIPVVAVVEEAKHGFDLLADGASSMIIFNPKQAENLFSKLLAARIEEAVSKAKHGSASRSLKRYDSGAIEKLIVIGSSTGGTDALAKILADIPDNCPPILVVQHMPPVFTQLFAERLHQNCRISVWEGKDGDVLKNGLAFIAPGSYHMVLAKKREREFFIKLNKDNPVHNQRPAVDVLFNSVVNVLGKDCKKVLGIILTGMGKDGAEGLLALRMAGAKTLGQDDKSCVVYGMPRVAYEIGAVGKQLNLNDMAPAIIQFVKVSK